MPSNCQTRVKVYRFEVGTETGDSRVVRDRVDSRDAQEAAVEEIAFEHEDGVIGLASDFRGIKRKVSNR